MIKDTVQREVVNKFLNHHTGRGSIILPTGTGKTRVALLIVKALIDQAKASSCLIITPTRILKGDSWPKEIKLMDMHQYNITIECKQTAYKWTDRHYDIVIIDEVHLGLSEVHGKILDIPCKYMIGLTATLPDHNVKYLDILLERLPIIFEMTLRECVDLGIVQPFDTYNLAIKLNPGERSKYNVFNGIFERSRNELRGLIKAYQLGISEFDAAHEYSKIEHKTHPMYKVAKAYWSSMSMRKWVCYRAKAKQKISIELIKKFPTKKWIIFSKEIDFVVSLYEQLQLEGISTVMYHSKMTKPEKEESLLRLEQEEIRVLVSAEALTTGYNLPDLDAAIVTSGSATEIIGIQTTGRINRYREGKTPLMINLYCDNTQEKLWVQSRTNYTQPEWVSSITKIKSNA